MLQSVIGRLSYFTIEVTAGVEVRDCTYASIIAYD